MDEPHRKTRRSFNNPGEAHFLTYSCQARWPLLAKDRARKWVIAAMEQARHRHEFDLLGYVIMPEHVHQLILPRKESYRFDRILADLKRPVSVKAKQYLVETHQMEWLERLTVYEGGESTFRFWLAGGGFDRNITNERCLWDMIEYMHENPVRRGLVGTALDWEWSSARYWAGLEPVHLKMDPLPP